MTNPETGKPKGFGFADFADVDAAASAVRNLNDYEINGRKIRVDYPHNNEKDSIPQDYNQQDSIGAPQGQAPGLPPLPPGTELAPNLKSGDAISQTLSALPPQQLLDVLTQMKGLVTSDPASATRLLTQAPQLSYAIFQALILMNLINPQDLGRVVEQVTRGAAASVPQPVQQPPPPAQYGYPQAAAPRPVPTPQQYAPPPPPMSQPQPSAAMTQEEMLRQVMQMDQAVIDSLGPTERAQIMALRAQLGGR